MDVKIDSALQDTLRDGYNALLMGYAAGTLDEAQSLLVASHLCLSPKGRNLMDAYDAIGGGLLEQGCAPVAMAQGSLENILDKIGSPSALISKPPVSELADLECMKGYDIPSPIHRSLADQKQALNWNKLFAGLHRLDLDLECKKSSVCFLKAEPGIKSPHHSHHGTEVTLVVDGAFHDETGTYERGDLLVIDEHNDHAPIACDRYGCMCIVASTAPVRLKGVASVLNPFLKK